jgi:thiamine biosynthesis protein ThiI
MSALWRHRLAGRGASDAEARLRAIFVHFHSYPILSRASIEKARELVRLLTTWQQRSRLYLVAFGDIQQQVVLAVPGRCASSCIAG